MYLSVDIPNHLNYSAAVYLDGVRQKHVVWVDDEKGEICRGVLNEKGDLSIEEGDIKTEIVTGNVRIIDLLKVDLAQVYLK